MREYRKIDIYVNGAYVVSTKQSRTLKEAIQRFRTEYRAGYFWHPQNIIKAVYARKKYKKR